LKILVSEVLLDSCVIHKFCDPFRVRKLRCKMVNTDRKAGTGNTKALNNVVSIEDLYIFKRTDEKPYF